MKNKSKTRDSYLHDNVTKVLFSDHFIRFSSSFSSLILGILCGYILLLIFNEANSGLALEYIFVTGFSSLANVNRFIYQAAPFVMTSLAFCFAYKAKQMNLGVPGQFAVGGFCAIVCALIGLPWPLNLLFSFLAGALWGILPALFKVHFHVPEIVSSIMFDWIAVIVIFIFLSNMPSMLNSTHSYTASIAEINAGGMLPSWGLNNWDSNFTIAIFIAILFAIICSVVINRTRLGYEMRAYALNASISQAAGISRTKIIMTSFAISGGLAGIGGALLYLAPYSIGYKLDYASLPYEGIIGIGTSILAFNNPMSCVVVALAFSYINAAGSRLVELGYSSASISFIMGSIIFFGSFGVVLNRWIRKRYLFRAWKYMVKKWAQWGERIADISKGQYHPQKKSNKMHDAIVKIADSPASTYYKEEEISTSFINYKDTSPKKKRIVVKLHMESDDLEDYNPNHYANADIPQLRRYKVEKGDKS
ncbi:MAG: ABC transporter permease [Bacilli bacterium]|nr:ABC transporter permease [Bacilli bacterium]